MKLNPTFVQVERAEPPKDHSAYLAEFVGTYLLTVAVGCNIIAGSRIWAATSIGSALMVLVYMFYHVSGAMLNPAVTFALGILKKKPWKEVGIYCAIQIAGGILGALTYGLFLWQVVTLEPKGGHTLGQAGLAEIFFTAMLVFVVLSTSTDQKQQGYQYYGLAIGFVIVAAAPSIGHISMCILNPAVAIGIDFSSALLGFYYWFPYILFELAGGALGACMFMATRPGAVWEGRQSSLGAHMAGEFLGTFYLVLVAGLNVLGKSIAPVWSIAAALMVMIYSIGNTPDLSGAQFNPAVTLAVVLSGRNLVPSGLGAQYMAVQFFAGVVGAAMFSIIGGGGFALTPGAQFGWSQVFVAETIFTFLLCYVVLCVMTLRPTADQWPKQFSGIAIAGCVTAGGIAVGKISGGILNPALALGIACGHLMGMSGNYELWWNVVPYMLFQFVGGALAAGVFRVTHKSEFTDIPK